MKKKEKIGKLKKKVILKKRKKTKRKRKKGKVSKKKKKKTPWITIVIHSVLCVGNSDSPTTFIICCNILNFMGKKNSVSF